MSKIVVFALFFGVVVAFGYAAPLIEESVDVVGEPTSSSNIPEGKNLTRVKRYERSTGERVKTYVYSTVAGAALGSFAGPVGAGVGATAGVVTALVLDLTGA